MSLSNISILIHICFPEEKRIKYETLVKIFFSFLKTNSHTFNYLYYVFFLVNFINDNIINK